MFNVEADRIVTDQRGDRDKKTKHSGEKSSGHAGGESLNIRLALHCHFRKRKHDPPNGTEQPKERTDADGGHQHNDFVFQLHDLICDRLFHRCPDHFDLGIGKRTGVQNACSAPVSVDLCKARISAFINAGDRGRIRFRAGAERHHIPFPPELLQETP